MCSAGDILDSKPDPWELGCSASVSRCLGSLQKGPCSPQPSVLWWPGTSVTTGLTFRWQEDRLFRDSLSSSGLGLQAVPAEKDCRVAHYIFESAHDYDKYIHILNEILFVNGSSSPLFLSSSYLLLTCSPCFPFLFSSSPLLSHCTV